MARSFNTVTSKPAEFGRTGAAVVSVGFPTEGARPANLILRSLPESELARFLDAAAPIPLQQHCVLYAPGEPVENVYLLDSGMVSLLTVGNDGRAIETAVVGREGLVGSSAVLGAEKAATQALVQISGTAYCAPVSQFRAVLDESPVLASLVHRYIHFLLFQAQQNALCHALHSIEARLCRWLLHACDVLEGDVLEMTQESCAHLLGVQRTSLSMIAHTLQIAGTIRTVRGKIEIVNRAQLEKNACECYRKLRQHPAVAAVLAAKPSYLSPQQGEAARASAPPGRATSAP